VRTHTHRSIYGTSLCSRVQGCCKQVGKARWWRKKNPRPMVEWAARAVLLVVVPYNTNSRWGVGTCVCRQASRSGFYFFISKEKNRARVSRVVCHALFLLLQILSSIIRSRVGYNTNKAPTSLLPCLDSSIPLACPPSLTYIQIGANLFLFSRKTNSVFQITTRAWVTPFPYS